MAENACEDVDIPNYSQGDQPLVDIDLDIPQSNSTEVEESMVRLG